MLRQIRKTIIKNLWNEYQKRTMHIPLIESHLKAQGLNHFYLDHFAIIDLPGPYTGIPFLYEIFSTLGYLLVGKDYLPNKQNDFAWMREINCLNRPVHDVLPQVVIADFRIDELPACIKKIILKYSTQSQPIAIIEIKKSIAHAVKHNDLKSAKKSIQLICQYFSGRDWPLPTLAEFFAVHEFNELLAWVLIFGRRPNHFTLSVHLFSLFKNLNHFNQFIEKDLKILLNHNGGRIKGSQQIGIEQSSTMGLEEKINLQDGLTQIRTEFVEFVWRHPLDPLHIEKTNLLWKNFFNGFISDHANHVIKSISL